MSMSTNVIGLRDGSSESHQKHVRVLEACIDANVRELPKETAEYFGSEFPEAHLADEAISVGLIDCAEEWSDEEWSGDSGGGYEVDVTRLPPGVVKIRFYNSF